MLEQIQSFIEYIKNQKIEIYNEFSLQHELGFFLRKSLENKFLQFERNISYFNAIKKDFIKREIDISIFNDNRSCLEAIELKFPRNGQYPEQMFSFCKDIMFLEQLLEAGFQKASLLIFADDKNFYHGNSDGIYSYFRKKSLLTGKILKPTGAKDKELFLRGSYFIDWLPVHDNLKYAWIETHEVFPK